MRFVNFCAKSFSFLLCFIQRVVSSSPRWVVRRRLGVRSAPE